MSAETWVIVASVASALQAAAAIVTLEAVRRTMKADRSMFEAEREEREKERAASSKAEAEARKLRRRRLAVETSARIEGALTRLGDKKVELQELMDTLASPTGYAMTPPDRYRLEPIWTADAISDDASLFESRTWRRFFDIALLYDAHERMTLRKEYLDSKSADLLMISLNAIDVNLVMLRSELERFTAGPVIEILD